MPLVLRLLAFLAIGLVVVVAACIAIGYRLGQMDRDYKAVRDAIDRLPEAGRPILEVCTTKYGRHELYLN